MSGVPGTDGPAADPVTGVLARAGLQECVDAAIADARRTGGGCSIFLFDVDHFKTVNDAYGHARGDAVLHQIAERTIDLVRRSDVLVRYGGDEFVLVLPGTGRAEAVQVGYRLVEGIKGAAFPGSPPLAVSISLGLATFPDEAANRDELLEVADRRNYLAKRRGRGRAVGDDLTSAGAAASGRLLERDTALAQAQDFLARLAVQGHATLRVVGDRGAGHTRFLTDVANLARLRGFLVRGVDEDPADDTPAEPTPRTTGLLVVADTDADPAAVDRLVRDLTARDDAPAVVVLMQAVHDPADAPVPLPLLATISLPPLSPSALHLWLRTTLRGEPSPALVEWLTGRSGGLIGRAERELNRLVDSGDLQEGGNGGWSVSPAVLNRAARVAEARRRLPATLSTLIGRGRDITQVTELIMSRRLVTLAGPGGVGKTRLSVAVADAVADEFDEGAVFVALAEATTTALVVSAVAGALDVAEEVGQPLTDRVVKDVADRGLLLVLDNFEQVLTAAPFVARILAAAPRVKVLTTSRQRLRLSGEQVYRVGPLALPDLDHLPARPQDVDAALAASPALALFVARAREAAFDLRLTPADVRAAAEVCHHLDGLPLAIELAAARCDTLSLAKVRHQLTERFELLTDGPQDLPRRQQTLRATIDWSFARLDAADQDLLLRLAVFAGGCPAEAVAAVCRRPGEDNGAVTDRLAGLVDKSLLGTATIPAGARYTMLESIRAYALERLAGSGVADEVFERHTAYFAHFAEQAGRELSGPGQADWSARVHQEYLNLRAAFERAMATGDAPAAGRIVLGLRRYWDKGWHRAEGWEWYQQVLAVQPPLPARLRAEVLHDAADAAWYRDDEEKTRLFAEECGRLADELDDAGLKPKALVVLAFAAELAGDQQRACSYLAESLALQQQRGDKMGIAVARGNLTLAKLALGDLTAAYELALLNLDLEREIGNLRGVAITLSVLGDIRAQWGDTAGARPLTTESLQIYQQIGDVHGQAWSTFELGELAQLNGDLAEAYQRIAAAIRLLHAVGDKPAMASMIVRLANVVADTDPARAARLLAAAEVVDEQQPRSRANAPHARGDETLALVRARLSDADLAAAWAAGRATSLDDVVAGLAAADQPTSVTAR